MGNKDRDFWRFINKHDYTYKFIQDMNREKVGILLKVGFLKHTNRMQFCSQGKKEGES